MRHHADPPEAPQLVDDVGALQGAMVMYVVYEHPRDYPTEFVVRRSAAAEGGLFADRQLFARGLTVEDVRAELPTGLTRMPREAGDDPQICEVWL